MGVEQIGQAAGGQGTVGKALDILDSIAEAGRPLRFAELQAGSRYPKATLYRFVQTLTREGMLSYDPDRQTYAPGMRLVRLAHAAWRQSSLAPVAEHHLDRLSRATGLTVHLAQLDAAQVLYVAKRNAMLPVRMFSETGKVGPAYCTGVGKAMLARLDPDALEAAVAQQSFHRFTLATLTSPAALHAELAEIRRTGIAFDREEHEAGIICAAAAIVTAAGRLLGALSITGTIDRLSLADLKDQAPRLTGIAKSIAADAETWAPPVPVDTAAGINGPDQTG